MSRTLKGRTCKLYRNTAVREDGTPNEEAAVWNEIDIVKDAKYQIDGQLADITVRRHGAVKREETIHDEVSGEFDLRVTGDPLQNADFLAIQTAKMNHTPIEFAFTNRAIDQAGTRAFRFVCEVASLGEEQPLGDAVKFTVTIKTTDSVLPPRFVTSTGDED